MIQVVMIEGDCGYFIEIHNGDKAITVRTYPKYEFVEGSPVMRFDPEAKRNALAYKAAIEEVLA